MLKTFSRPDAKIITSFKSYLKIQLLPIRKHTASLLKQRAVDDSNFIFTLTFSIVTDSDFIQKAVKSRLNLV
jgi:hypothetical protein